MNIPNIDTLCATIDIRDYGHIVHDKNGNLDLLIKLENEKFKAREKSADNMNYKHLIQIGNQSFELIPNGSRGYAYILHNDFYEIKLAQFRSRKESFYPVFIRIKSECLWHMGVFKAWRKITEWVSKNVGEIKANKINRVDLCCHTDELSLYADDIETFEGRYQVDTIYRYRRQIATMNFGSGTTGKIMCRIYNKTLEVMQKKQKLWFLDLWENKGLNPKNVWNIEFELSRDLMKELKMESVEDVFKNLKSLWQYCTHEWLTKRIIDNNRMTRCSIDPRWQSIQKAFDNFEGEMLISREKQLQTAAFALIPGTIGNITSFAARADITDIDHLFRVIMTQGAAYLHKKETDYLEIIEDKKSLLAQ